MRIEDSYPSPVLGVSTLADRNRTKGQASIQENFRSDPLKKLIRRPSMKWLDTLLPKQVISEVEYPWTKDNFINHAYIRNGIEYRLLISRFKNALGDINVNGYVDGVEVPVTGDLAGLGDYADDASGSNTQWKLETIEDTSYILNPNREVKLVFGSNDLNDIEKVSHINVLSALNYGETVQVNVIKSDNSKHSISYTIPDLGTSNPDYDTADKARATKQVALELAARINAGGTYPTGLIPNPDFPTDPINDTDWKTYCNPYRDDGASGCELNPDFDDTQSVCKPYLDSFTGVAGVTAVALGSTVAVWQDDGNWLELEIETGQGDRSCVAFNRTIENADGLPLFAKVGTRITVRPDPISEKGTYYLQAERIASDANGEVLEEVVWSQSRSANGDHVLNQTTLPFKCTYDGTQFVISEGGYTERKAGDNNSVKVPKFVNNTISDISYFQKRLVLLSGNNVIMSEADDLDNFWKQSAIQLLATDPVSIASSATNVDVLDQVTTHNKDLLVIASNGQFKIDGSQAVTPETISMPLTTSYECQSQVKPVGIGNSVFFPINYGDSSGIKEYTGERETDQDLADSITNHIIGYMKGEVELISANANLNMLAVTTKDNKDNVVYIYEYKRSQQGDLIQAAWSTWSLPEDTIIVDLEFIKDKLIILAVDNGDIVRKEIDMYSPAVSEVAEIYLDNLLVLDTDGLTATIPDNYNTNDIIVIRGTGTEYELNKVEFTLTGSTITFDEDITAGKVYVGRQFVSTYRPTRPFRYEEDGTAITTDRLRVSRYILSLVDTNLVRMRTISDYYTLEDQSFNSKWLGDLQTTVGTLPLYSGDIKFSFGNDADLAEAEFYCDNWLGCSIVDLSWEGQYYQSKRRM